jgi:hypothetical protein
MAQYLRTENMAPQLHCAKKLSAAVKLNLSLKYIRISGPRAKARLRRVRSRNRYW